MRSAWISPGDKQHTPRDDTRRPTGIHGAPNSDRRGGSQRPSTRRACGRASRAAWPARKRAPRAARSRTGRTSSCQATPASQRRTPRDTHTTHTVANAGWSLYGIHTPGRATRPSSQLHIYRRRRDVETKGKLGRSREESEKTYICARASRLQHREAQPDEDVAHPVELRSARLRGDRVVSVVPIAARESDSRFERPSWLRSSRNGRRTTATRVARTTDSVRQGNAHL